MIVLYTGITERIMTHFSLAGGITASALGATSLLCRKSCVGDEHTHILEALSDALSKCDDSAFCYVLELAVNESQVLDSDTPEVDLTVAEIPLKNIINVYKFEVTPKLRTVGAIFASRMGCTELSERFGINYLGEGVNAFLGWFWGLNVKPPVLGVTFFSQRNIPVAGKKMLSVAEIKETLRSYVEAIKSYSEKEVAIGDTIPGRMSINGVGELEINLNSLLNIASPVTLAEILSGDSREIVKHLETDNPVCALASLVEELLITLIPGGEFSMEVTFDPSALERELLTRDPEKYSLTMEALRKIEKLNKRL